MCEPSTLVLAASVVGSSLQVIQQTQQQRAVTSAQNRQLAANAASAEEAYRSNYNQEQRRQVEEGAAASDQLHANQIASLEAQAAAIASSASAGVSGITPDAQVGAVIAREGRSTSAITRTLDASRRQSEERLLAYDAQRRSRILGANVTPPQGPDYGGAFANIISGYAMSKQLDALANPPDLTKSQRIIA